jgi:hypothetical protein
MFGFRYFLFVIPDLIRDPVAGWLVCGLYWVQWGGSVWVFELPKELAAK